MVLVVVSWPFVLVMLLGYHGHVRAHACKPARHDRGHHPNGGMLYLVPVVVVVLLLAGVGVFIVIVVVHQVP